MMISEPRCMVCGAPLDSGAPFEQIVRRSEVCSDECYDIYMRIEEEEYCTEEYCLGSGCKHEYCIGHVTQHGGKNGFRTST